ncbi:MAG: hypothetical protein H5U06_10605 [Candidatus Aminicenantes bacterium]|nr:hypothetical protein [Candidatus Aminicenantes bacterium]
MEEKKLVSFLQQTVKILEDFFPVNSSALFPLLNSTLIWALTRAGQIKAKVLELEVWLEPEILENKPDEFVFNFFESNPQLKKAYAEELSRKELKALRKAFRVLYPVIGLEDPFLEKLFSEELSQGNYRSIVDSFEARLNKALSEIKAAQAEPKFWDNLEKVGHEFLNLGWGWLNEAEIRKQLRQILDRMVKEN